MEICPRCTQTVSSPLPELVDLHRLVRRETLELVAEVAGVSPGQLKHLRSGSRQIGVDALYRISKRWPDFDSRETMLRLGALREERADKTKEPRQ